LLSLGDLFQLRLVLRNLLAQRLDHLVNFGLKLLRLNEELAGILGPDSRLASIGVLA